MDRKRASRVGIDRQYGLRHIPAKLQFDRSGVGTEGILVVIDIDNVVRVRVWDDVQGIQFSREDRTIRRYQWLRREWKRVDRTIRGWRSGTGNTEQKRVRVIASVVENLYVDVTSDPRQIRRVAGTT
jgi:hypothetical protein